MVTTLYRALDGGTLWSKLEALGISTDFMGGVLVAREMEGGIKFALGATMAAKKSVLAKIGGLEYRLVGCARRRLRVGSACGRRGI